MKKIIFLVVLIVLASGIGLFLFFRQRMGTLGLEGKVREDIMYGNLGSPIKYRHPVLEYELEYPSDWTGGTQEIIPGGDQTYQDFQIFSPKFKLSDENNPVLLFGSTILVRGEKSEEKDIKNWLSNQPYFPEVSKKRKLVFVDHIQTVQYEYSGDGTDKTESVLIRNGVLYTIRFRYSDLAEKNARWSIYSNLLNSFQLPQ